MKGSREDHDVAKSERISLVNAGEDDYHDDDVAKNAFNRSSRAGQIGGGAAAAAAADAPERFVGASVVAGSSSSFAATEQRRRNFMQSFETEPSSSDGTSSRRSSPSPSVGVREPKSTRYRQAVLVSCGLLLLGGLLVLVKDRTSSDNGSDGTVSDAPFVAFDYDPVPSLYYAKEGNPILADNGEPVSYTLSEIRRRFDAAKKALLDTLEVQYGSAYVHSIFNNMTALRSPPSSTGNIGWERMKRKLQIKVLAVQLRAGDGGGAKDAKMEPFVWATGGHSGTVTPACFVRHMMTPLLMFVILFHSLN
jgi:hypothetical protein